MARGKQYVPFMPTLSPAVLFTNTARDPDAFPFSSDRVQYYYLARNAIWHGVDALGLKPGDAVLMPSYAHGVEIQTLLSKGLKLTYYRINKDLSIDFEHLESLITSSTRALYVIHYLGFAQPIERLREMADKRGLTLIEDCALSMFSTIPAGPLGSFGDAGIFCIYKTLPVPHGGLIVMNRPDLAMPEPPGKPGLSSTCSYVARRALEHFEAAWGPLHRIGSVAKSAGRLFKRSINATTIPVDTNEFEENMVDLGLSSIAMGIIRRLDHADVVRRRRENFTGLLERLDKSVRVLFSELPEGVCPLSMPVMVHDKRSLRETLLEDGIETVNFWSNRNADIPDAFPEADFLREHLLEVPIHQGLTEKHIDYMAVKLKERARW